MSACIACWALMRGVLVRVERVGRPDEAAVEWEVGEERRAVGVVVSEWLAVGEARGLPWKDSLEEVMFYLYL